MWNKSSTYRASKAFLARQVPPEGDAPDLVCLSYTHDDDYEKYKEYAAHPQSTRNQPAISPQSPRASPACDSWSPRACNPAGTRRASGPRPTAAADADATSRAVRYEPMG
jgi:hypothetical protein